MSKRIDGLAGAFVLAIASCAAVIAENPVQPRDMSREVLPVKEPASQPSWREVGQALSSKPHEAPPTENPRLVPCVDYTGDLSQRAAMTGDWGGVRQQMMDKGFRFDLSLTQMLQGNVSGGVSKRATYSGGLRLDMDLDTGAAGLWPGGMFHVRGETKYGTNNNPYAGSLMPVNNNALYPMPTRDTACLSEAYYMQFVAPWLGFVAGKMSPRDTNVFSHDETEQFSNSAFNFNPVLGTTIPLDCLAAGVILRPTDWFMLTTMLLDTDGTSSISGFDTAFERGTSIFQQAEFGIKPFGQEGHQRLSWNWTDKARVKLRQDPSLIIRDIVLEKLGLGSGPSVDRSGSDWCMMYDFDQYVYTKPGTKDQGIGLFGRFGFDDGSVNPVQYFYSLGVGGKGMIPGRDNDTFGVGYYYIAVSNKLGPILDTLTASDEQGVELYYNIAVTPWLHITPDIQVIDSGRNKYSDTAVVFGLRMKIDF